MRQMKPSKKEQLRVDAFEVFLAKTKKLSDFSLERQQEIKVFYRFCGTMAEHEAGPAQRGDK